MKDIKEQEIEKTTIESWHDPRSKLQQYQALIVGVYKKNSDKKTTQEHLKELQLLAETHGIQVVQSLPIMVRSFCASTFITSGKVEELREKARSLGANIIIFDDEISPVQQRNLEKEIRIPVVDRTEIILAVFVDRAKSHEAKLQIELAQLRHMAPRLKRMWTHLSRQSGGGGGSGGGGYLKGEGEKQIEIDRRIIQHRINRLQDELLAVKQHRVIQRSLRERNGIPSFAIVGYTNAGKSTLMKRLTHADVLVEDKLFATLDTTTRHYNLPNNQEVLITDTVGFIRKLPHLLVAAFKSTLEEAIESDILLHIIDSSHPQAFEQSRTTLTVLQELKAEETPMITIVNKIDFFSLEERKSSEMIQKLRESYPDAVFISTETGEGIDVLLQAMVTALQARRRRLQLSIPQSEYHYIAAAMRIGKIYSQSYEGNDVLIDVELPVIYAEKLLPFVTTESNE